MMIPYVCIRRQFLFVLNSTACAIVWEEKVFQLILVLLWKRRKVEWSHVDNCFSEEIIKENFSVPFKLARLLATFKTRGIPLDEWLANILTHVWAFMFSRTQISVGNKLFRGEQAGSRGKKKTKHKTVESCMKWNHSNTFFLVERFKTRQNEIVVDWLLIYGQLFFFLFLLSRAAHCLEVHVKRSENMNLKWDECDQSSGKLALLKSELRWIVEWSTAGKFEFEIRAGKLLHHYSWWLVINSIEHIHHPPVSQSISWWIRWNLLPLWNIIGMTLEA